MLQLQGIEPTAQVSPISHIPLPPGNGLAIGMLGGGRAGPPLAFDVVVLQREGLELVRVKPLGALQSGLGEGDHELKRRSRPAEGTEVKPSCSKVASCSAAGRRASSCSESESHTSLETKRSSHVTRPAGHLHSP